MNEPQTLNERITERVGQDDYVYKTIEEYEKIVGFKVNKAFKIGWDMARTTMKQLKQLGDK